MKFKKEKSFFVMHLLFFWFLPVFVFAGTAYYVDPNAAGGGNGSYSNPWNKISQINAKTFDTGDDIYFKAGSVMDADVKLIIRHSGTSSNRVIIGAYRSETLLTRGTQPRPIIRGTLYRDPAITVPHVPSGDYDAIIDCSFPGAGYITVQELEIRESYTAGIRIGNGGDRTRGSQTSHNIIRDNIITNAGGQGIVLNMSWHGLIEGNYVNGACLRPGRNPKKPATWSGASIVIMGGNRDYMSRHNVIRNNTVRRGFEMIGIYQGPQYTDVIDNIIYEFTDMGIYASNCLYGTISGNIVYNTNIVWWPHYQAQDKGIQAGIQVDSEGHQEHLENAAGGYDVYNNYIAHAKWGIMIASRANHKGIGHVKTRVFNNRIVESKIANMVCRKGSLDTMAEVSDTWEDNYMYDNYSFMYTMSSIYTAAPVHVENKSRNWPGVTWAVEATRNTDWTLTATTTKKGNYYNTDISSPPTGNAANNARINQVELVRKTGWRDLAPGEVTKSWFEFAGEVLTPKPVAITNLRLE